MDHVGARRKFVTFSEAVRTALRKMLDQFDQVDARHGRLERRLPPRGRWRRGR
jgi:Arc/MetJ-type ribon-helix-helix transcriptional regulator